MVVIIIDICIANINIGQCIAKAALTAKTPSGPHERAQMSPRRNEV